MGIATTLAKYLPKAASVVGVWLDTNQLVTNEMVRVLAELGDVQFRTALRDLSIAPHSNDPKRFIWSASHHLDEAYEAFHAITLAKGLPQITQKATIENAYAKCVFTALMMTLCYRICDEPYAAGFYCQLASNVLGAGIDECEIQAVDTGENDPADNPYIAEFIEVFRKDEEVYRSFAQILIRLREDKEAKVLAYKSGWTFDLSRIFDLNN